MNKTLAIFLTVVVIFAISCICAYLNEPEPEPVKTQEIIAEETKAKEPAAEKKDYKPTEPKTTSKIDEDDIYRNDYPFYGMDEKYVEKTILGKADRIDSDYEVYGDHIIITKSYIWLNSNGTYRAYAITGEDLFEEGKRMVYSFTDCGKKTYYSSGKSSSKSDPYNAKDYGYADDFYDEYWDDFYDYEDAEDYWMEHQ